MRHLSQPIGMNFRLSMYSLILLGAMMIAVFVLWALTLNDLYKTIAVLLSAVCGALLLLNGAMTMNVVRKGDNADISEYKERTVLMYDRHDYAIIEDDLENMK